MAIVCSPDEQKRLTVIPDVVTGQPARMAICLAILRPVAPSGLAQPMITSSISAGSAFARSIALPRASPAVSAPWVMLNAPRQLLQSGVRAVETITASGMVVGPWSLVVGPWSSVLAVGRSSWSLVASRPTDDPQPRPTTKTDDQD